MKDSAFYGFYVSDRADMGTGRLWREATEEEISKAILGKPFDWSIFRHPDGEWRFLPIIPSIVSQRAFLGIGFQADMLAAAWSELTGRDISGAEVAP